jgi:hypothetical protein
MIVKILGYLLRQKKLPFELNVSYLVNKVTRHLENSGLIGGEPPKDA